MLMYLKNELGVVVEDEDRFCKENVPQVYGIEVQVPLDDDPYYTYPKLVGIFLSKEAAARVVADNYSSEKLRAKIIVINVGYYLESPIYDDFSSI